MKTSRREVLTLASLSLLGTRCGSGGPSGSRRDGGFFPSPDGGLRTTDAGFVGDSGSPLRDGGTIPDAGESDASATRPDAGTPPRFTVDRNYARLGCAFPPALSLYQARRRLVGLCTKGGGANERNEVFQFDPEDTSRPIQPSTVVSLPDAQGRFLNYSTELHSSLAPTINPNLRIVTTNDGFYIVDTMANGYHFIGYPSHYNSGGGALVIGTTLFMTVANLDFATMGYQTGMVLVYDLRDSTAVDQLVNENSARAIPTSHLNPTGLNVDNQGRLVVLNSGDFSNNPVPSLNFINTAQQILRGNETIPLPTQTTSLTGRLALTDDGMSAVFGTASGSGKVSVVNLQSGNIRRGNLAGTSFLSSIVTGRGHLSHQAFATDFNAEWVIPVDLDSLISGTPIAVPSSLTVHGAGPSDLVGDDLIQTLPQEAVRIYVG